MPTARSCEDGIGIPFGSPCSAAAVLSTRLQSQLASASGILAASSWQWARLKQHAAAQMRWPPVCCGAAVLGPHGSLPCTLCNGREVSCTGQPVPPLPAQAQCYCCWTLRPTAEPAPCACQTTRPMPKFGLPLRQPACAVRSPSDGAQHGSGGPVQQQRAVAHRQGASSSTTDLRQ